MKAELQQDVARRERDLKKRLKTLKQEEEVIAKTREGLEEKIQDGIKERLREIEAKTAKKMEGKYADQLKELQCDLKERDEAIAVFRDQERELRKKQRQLEESQKSVDLEVSRRLDKERETIKIEASKIEASKIEATKYEGQLKELVENLGKKGEAIKEFRQQKIELRRRQRELAATPMTTNQQINSVAFGPTMAPEYGFQCLRMLAPALAGTAGAVTVPIVKKSYFATLSIPVSPEELQSRYALLWQHHWHTLQKVRLRTARLDDLFSILLHRAFAGDLTAKWREAHMTELLVEMEAQAKALEDGGC